MRRALKPAILSAAALLLLSGCSPGKVYGVPIEEARKTLEATGIPPVVFGTDSESAPFSVKSGPTQVIWTIEKDGGEVLHYTANLSAAGDRRTRVSVELKGATQGPFGDVDKRLSDNASIKQMYQVAVEERVGSALEHREFDLTKVYPTLALATLANMPRLSAQLDEAAAASEKQDRENIEKAYAEEAKHGGY